MTMRDEDDEPFELPDWPERNHRQSLDELARRGWLSACEAVAILEDRPWREMAADAAIARLAELVALAVPPEVA